MLAKDIAIEGFPMLRLEDTAAFVLKCMDDFEVQHLPVVKDDYFVGLVSKEAILDIDSKQTIAQLIDPLLRFGINASAHFLTALQLFSKHQLSLLPVLNEQQECIGVIPQKNLNDQLAQFLGLGQPGAIIVLSISPLQYSLAEMSRLVETNNAQIVQLNSYFDETNGSMVITIKLNKEEASSIIATFQRYDYQVLHYFGSSPLNNDIEDHYLHLMNYLDV
ncbi:MAG: CBS domain-containing protein [Chitinophagia bacterium]|jgi:predicted transcriptional regulator